LDTENRQQRETEHVLSTSEVVVVKLHLGPFHPYLGLYTISRFEIMVIAELTA
jgi:hypothetical protein